LSNQGEIEDLDYYLLLGGDSRLTCDEIELEEILNEIARIGYIKYKIDHRKSLIQFKIYDNTTEAFSRTFKNFINEGKYIIKDITLYLNPNKCEKIQEKVENKLQKMKNESISKAHEIIEENAYDLRKLKRFIVRRKTAIFDSKDATLNQKEKEKEKRITKEIEEKIMKKDKQKRKELELQMKKICN
jgi:hypothetical protein